MRLYIREHVSRMREIWKVGCIPNESRETPDQSDVLNDKRNTFNQRHQTSLVQNYGNLAEGKRIQTVARVGEIQTYEAGK